jgi:uncharacterized protein (TIGR00730 family)
MAMNTIDNTAKIRRICVYCGSGPGTNPAYIAAARAFGEIIAKNRIGLVFGGGSVGMMGEVAQAVRSNGGEVNGIIPEFLVERERARRNAPGLVVTRDMHERKRKMFEMADAFVAFPGGIGTLEEIVEQMTWAQLGRHKKPILLANIKGFWEPLRTLLDHMKATQFIRSELSFDLLVADKVEDILPMLQKALAGLPEAAKEMSAADPSRL